MEAFSFLLREVRASALHFQLRGGILVGLSGGADSVALLRVLCALREELRLDVSAACINHGLRAGADGEVVFCAALCRELQVPFYSEKVTVPPAGSVEAEAREARYAALYRLMEQSGASTLALGHHLDDQAETVLMHLLYGAGVDGLGGMHPYRAPVWRPFLHVRRETIRQAMQELRQPWCEDDSNQDETMARNYLRNKILPSVHQLYPGAAEAVSRAADILREENDYLYRQAACWLEKFASKGEFPFLMAGPLQAEHIAMQRRILRAYCARHGICMEWSHTEDMRQLLTADAGAVCNLPGGWRAMRSKSRIHLLSPATRHVVWPQDSLQGLPYSGQQGDGLLSQAFPAQLLEGATLRTRREGDVIRPFGMQGTMKLKDYMISREIDRPFRDAWPLLCRENRVLWVIGRGCSEDARISSPDEKTVFVRFAGKLPDQL